MDILFISRCPPFPLFHGDRLIPFHLCRGLSAHLHRIDLLAFYQKPEDLADVPRYERFYSSVTLVREPTRTRMSYQQRSRKPDRRFPTRAEDSWSPDMWQHILTATQTHAYDVVHLFGGVHVYEYYHLIRHLPNVIVPYESFSLWLERAVDEEKHRLARWFKRAQLRMARDFESWMFEPYDRTVVLTDHDARMLKSLSPNTATVVIPNGVDVDYFTPTGYDPDEPALLFTGNYDYAPNLDAALRLVRDIFPRIHQAMPAARLYVVGGNPSPELLAYASESIEIPGRVPDLRPYFELASVFISPLRLGAGIKNKILEAMAMETPVVATPLSCDGIPVIQGEQVMLGVSDEELAESALRLLQDATLRRTMADNGRQLIEQRFTWTRVAELYNDLYRQVIQERRDLRPQSNGR